MKVNGPMEHLAQAAQETLPAEQPVKNLENPPAFGRQESAEGIGDAPPKIERGGTRGEAAFGRSMESSPLREVYRPEPPKDILHMTPQERAKAALEQNQSRHPHPGSGIH